MLRRGDHDAAVGSLRDSLAAVGLLPPRASSGGTHRDDDTFDEYVDAAVRAFQQQRGLIVDGRVGPATDRELVAARWTLGDRPLSYTLSSPMVGDDVTALQQRMAELGYDAGRPDGVFTPRLDAVVRQFQQHRGLTDDGVFGSVTLRELERIAPMATGGSPQYLREMAALQQAGPFLRGKRIVLDPAHGGDEQGWAIDGACARDITFDIALRVRDRMTSAGMQVSLTRPENHNPSQAERAAFANEVSADLVISLHVDGLASPRAGGIATFHFGSEAGTVSSVGESLAQLVHRELIARTGMIDCRVHRRPWEILRLTQMPTIQVELGYLTNEMDRARLADPSFLDRVADGTVVGVKRLYMDGRDDRPTGTFTFHDLLAYEQAVRSA